MRGHAATRSSEYFFNQRGMGAIFLMDVSASLVILKTGHGA
jgi:hypothetical protein